MLLIDAIGSVGTINLITIGLEAVNEGFSNNYDSETDVDGDDITNLTGRAAKTISINCNIASNNSKRAEHKSFSDMQKVDAEIVKVRSLLEEPTVVQVISGTDSAVTANDRGYFIVVSGTISTSNFRTEIDGEPITTSISIELVENTAGEPSDG